MTDYPTNFNWGNCNFKCAWHRFRLAITRIGYVEQYPYKVDHIIPEAQNNISKYTDWEIIDNEIESFTDENNDDLLDYERPPFFDHTRPRIFQNRDFQNKWTALCIRMEDVIDKYHALGMFQKIKIKSKRGKIDNESENSVDKIEKFVNKINPMIMEQK